LKKALQRKRVFIDTNIFIYVAIKHPEFYKSSYGVLEMLVDGEFTGYGSKLILFELFGALSRINPLAAYEAAHYYLNLPLRIIDLDRKSLELARDIARGSGTTYDAVHAAMMMSNNITVIVTEDIQDWLKIQNTWSKVTRKHKLEISPLEVFVPSREFQRTR